MMLLPRAHLSLACLDLVAPLGDFQYARFYESTVKILDLESRMGSQPVVLIARLETDKTLYALERQDNGLYTLCKLGGWVDLEKMSSHATVAYSKLIRPRPKTSPEHGQPEPLETPQLHKENKKRRVAIEAIQSLVKRPPRARSISLHSQVAEIIEAPTPAEDESTHLEVSDVSTPIPPEVPKPSATPVPEEISPPTAGDMFNNIRNQYLEALYHSMVGFPPSSGATFWIADEIQGSLAYFAKGPLSRARAAFHLDFDANLDMKDLIGFLKSLVLTTVQIDKKYRETVPEILAKMKIHMADSADEQDAKSKKRKSKKMKIGKDGMYPMEDEHVRKWWDAHKPQPKDDDSMVTEVPQETRLQISRLRSRETQLQMILILEILALESTKTASNSIDSALPGLPGEDPHADLSKEETPKKRNKHNLPVLLEVHADRLSIWQSTSFEEIKMLDESQSGAHTSEQKPSRSTSDPLRDFCVDIIVPFFSSRLPEQCDSLNRKLGGPVMPSPAKPKPKKPEAVAKPKTKPGAVTKRAAVPKTGRTLERVLSKETERHRRSMSRGPGSVIALMRSASTPALSILKRESNDVPVTNVPRRDSKDAGGVQNKDSGPSPHGSAKRGNPEERARRDAEIKAELRDAISGLRKPNREVVGKAMAEADERKATTSLSQLRKSRKPTQHPGVPSIVKATPAGPRFRNALARDAHSQPIMGKIHESVEMEHVPSSYSQGLVPSSASRKRSRDAAFLARGSPELPGLRTTPDLVDATPVRPAGLRQNLIPAPEFDEGLVLASSPVVARKFLNVPRTSLGHRDSGLGMPSSPGGGLVETPAKKPRVGGVGSLEGYVTVTPVKKRAPNQTVATPVQPEAAKEKGTPRKLTLFEKMGWDDDYDDLL